jgi:hypothetical protein
MWVSFSILIWYIRSSPYKGNKSQSNTYIMRIMKGEKNV